MQSELVCPVCKEAGKIYGLPYGLPITSAVKGENTDVHQVVLIHCEGCGAVLGGYKNQSN
jgi:hypothetical protein